MVYPARDMVFLATSLITGAIQLSGYAVAYALQTEKFYDILGGLNFLAVAAYSAATADGWAEDQRKVAATLIFVCSRGWLLAFLSWRAHERGGDARFDGVKDKAGEFLVFWVAQGVWVSLISSPVLLLNASEASPPLGPWDVALLCGFLLGVVCEVAADVQKAVWVRAGRQGGFCTAGLWRYSRHPNYFGEILQWWCAWLVAAAAASGVADPYWWLTAASPLFTMHVLLNIPATGVTQANGKNLRRYYEADKGVREAYARYRTSTSILLPMVGYERVPIALKRTLFLDFERYEYRPSGKKE